MHSIKQLLDNSAKGIAFPVPSIMKVYGQLEEMLKLESGFDQMIKLIQILHMLAEDPDGRLLSSSSFAATNINSESRRLKKAQDYIAQNYKNDIRLNDLGDLAGMSPSSFSRFFKKNKGFTPKEFREIYKRNKILIQPAGACISLKHNS